MGVSREPPTESLGLGPTYYLRYRITNLGPELEAASLPAAIPRLRTSGSTSYGGFTIEFGTSACEATPPPKPFVTGKTWTSCMSYSISGSTWAYYDGNVGSYVASPVTWGWTR